MKQRGDMFLRFVIYSLIAYFVIRFVRKLMTPSRPTSAPRREATGKRSDSAVMVRCSACGTFITETSAMITGGGKYCSSACAQSRVRTA
jgi:hypothetical protein